MRPPPRSTLFPYTTLFRSTRRIARGLRVKAGDILNDRRSRSSLPAARGVDRKSTRLNSSHQIISYAVFCLKKKTSHALFVNRADDDARAVLLREFKNFPES